VGAVTGDGVELAGHDLIVSSGHDLIFHFVELLEMPPSVAEDFAERLVFGLVECRVAGEAFDELSDLGLIR